jgi:hypothetical protein
MGPLSYMRYVVDLNFFIRRIPVGVLCFEWECERLKTEKLEVFSPYELRQRKIWG